MYRHTEGELDRLQMMDHMYLDIYMLMNSLPYHWGILVL